MIVTFLLSGCQATSVSTSSSSDIPKSDFSFSQYYLWMKTLTHEELIAEEKRQSSLLASDKEKHLQSQNKLILIYSLPYTPLHKPYKAKRLLNEHLLSSNNEGMDNVSFTMLLRDQLNFQLTLLSRKQAENNDYKEVAAEDKLLIKYLQSQLEQVNQQLQLLKQIDQNINERG